MSDSNELEQRFIDLETKMAFMENTVDELNEVVTKQQDQIDELMTKMRRFLSDFQNLVSVIKDKGDEAPPPHY